MPDTIKCTCSHCGAKYRLPIEAQGRFARCKKCGEKFQVPQEENLEDTVLSWLNEGENEEESSAQPRVISLPKRESGSDAANKARGPIRLKAETAPPKE